MRRTGWTRGLPDALGRPRFRGKGCAAGARPHSKIRKGVLKMRLSQNIAGLRHAAGWSQEELAARLDVTRQSVSKWESGQSVPDAERLVKLSELFGVSVDFLLKGDGPPAGERASAAASAARLVTAGEAADYLALRGRAAGAHRGRDVPVHPVAGLPAAARGRERRRGGALSETAATGYGLAALLVLVAGAVALFIHCGLQSAPLSVSGRAVHARAGGGGAGARGRLEADKRAYGRKCVAGGVLCVLAALPLLLTAILTGGGRACGRRFALRDAAARGRGKRAFSSLPASPAPPPSGFCRSASTRARPSGRARCWRCFPRCTGLRRRPFICC